MAKGTILFIFFLAILATLLFGINIGKKINTSFNNPLPSPTKTITPTNSITPLPTNATKTSNGITSFTNPSCGYEISYPQDWIKIETDPKAIALSNPTASASGNIAIICAKNLPIPTLSPEKIITYQLGTVSARLYHTTSSDKSPLDEIIANIPGKDMQIAIAGFGSTLNTILNSFKFLP